MNPTTIGELVRWARKRAGMTQHDLARAVEMPQPTIARIEAGAVSPRTSTLTAILEATGYRLALEPMAHDLDLDAVAGRVAVSVPTRTSRALGSAARDPQTSPIRIVRRLRRFAVPFVLIGELAEVAHGAPWHVGRLVEVCHARTDVARERLAMALDDLAGTSADGVEVKSRAGTLRLATETAAGDDYDTLARNAVRLQVTSGVPAPVASIEDLIRSRRARGTPEDRRAADVLRAVADETLSRRRAGL